MKAEEAVNLYGMDIISSSGMDIEKECLQHGRTSVFVHSFNVACLCFSIAEKLNLKVDKKSLIRGALLHDYFLYDWHVNDKSHKWHGFTHPKTALINATKDFELNSIEKDMILKHMFPLNLSVPRYKESVVLCISDKILAICETLGIKRFRYDLKR